MQGAEGNPQGIMSNAKKGAHVTLVTQADDRPYRGIGLP
jgi:hypothetical protein